MAKVRVALRMEQTLKENIDKVAEATGKDRTEVIEQFCKAGIMRMQQLIDEKRKIHQED